MRDWQHIAILLHRRCLSLRLKLECELSVSKRISEAGVRVTAELQAERKKVLELRETLGEWLEVIRSMSASV